MKLTADNASGNVGGPTTNDIDELHTRTEEVQSHHERMARQLEKSYAALLKKGEGENTSSDTVSPDKSLSSEEANEGSV